MNEELKLSYKDYTIFWLDYNRTFEISKDDISIKHGFLTIEDSKKWIDQKEKEKFDRVSVIFMQYNESPENAEITSIIDDEYVWIVNEHKKRSKENLERIIFSTPENIEKIEQYKKIKEQSRKLDSEANKILSSIPRIKIKDITK